MILHFIENSIRLKITINREKRQNLVFKTLFLSKKFVFFLNLKYYYIIKYYLPLFDTRRGISMRHDNAYIIT